MPDDDRAPAPGETVRASLMWRGDDEMGPLSLIHI